MANLVNITKSGNDFYRVFSDHKNLSLLTKFNKVWYIVSHKRFNKCVTHVAIRLYQVCVSVIDIQTYHAI